jgi:HEAT repeat protein
MAATLLLMLSLLLGCGSTDSQGRQDVRELAAQLSSGDPSVRAKAACSLREFGGDAAAAIDALVALLPDGAPVEQQICERNWGRWNTGQPTTTPGEQAASALVAIGSRTLKPLLAGIRHSSWIARRNSAWALGALDDPTALPALAGALGDQESPVREQAAWALGALDDTSATPKLVDALKDDSAKVRRQAAWALGAIDDPRAVEGLMRALKDNDDGVRQQAAWALGAIGDSRAVDALLPALKDPSAGVRRQAAWAIGVIGR